MRVSSLFSHGTGVFSRTLVTLCLCVCFGCLATIAAYLPGPFITNPIGVARGICPGRVVWAHDPRATSWNGNSTNHWYDPWNVDQARVAALLDASVQDLVGGASSVSAAWQSIFTDHNAARGRGPIGYQAGETIAIKINMNEAGYTNKVKNNTIDASPQVVYAVLRALIEDVAVPAANITVYEASKCILEYVYAPNSGAFPAVHFVDYSGEGGRAPITWTTSQPLCWGTNGMRTNVYLDACSAQATYLVNISVLKHHGGAGVTFGAKNFYGCLSVRPYLIDLHRWSNTPGLTNGYARYDPRVDLLGHTNLGGKVALWITDALYGSVSQPGLSRWQMPPFNNDWPSSLFVAQDPVALEAVGLDFLYEERRRRSYTLPDCVDNYLREAACADNPGSGVRYDPEGDGSTLTSLGVYENWCNATSKQYSRNLGTGAGIELRYVQVPEPAVMLALLATTIVMVARARACRAASPDVARGRLGGGGSLWRTGGAAGRDQCDARAGRCIVGRAADGQRHVHRHARPPGGWQLVSLV